MSTPSSPALRVYRPDLLTRVPIWGLMIFFPVFMAYLIIRNHQHNTTVLGLSLFALVLPAICYLAIGRARLELSREGMNVFVNGSMVRTPWSNVVRLRICGLHVGFTTNDPVKSPGVLRTFGFTDDVQELVRLRRYIPLDTFRHHLLQGDFVEQVDLLAPHVHLRETLGPKQAR